jgi:hypothetical protein
MLVMNPFLVQQTKVGSAFPSKMQVDPMGKSLSRPPLYFSSPLFSSNVPGLSISEPNGLMQEASVADNLFAATITAHVTGSPDAAVNPWTVKLQSL